MRLAIQLIAIIVPLILEDLRFDLPNSDASQNEDEETVENSQQHRERQRPFFIQRQEQLHS